MENCPSAPVAAKVLITQLYNEIVCVTVINILGHVSIALVPLIKLFVVFCRLITISRIDATPNTYCYDI